MTELDEILLDVIRPRVQKHLKFLVVLTKADKLTRSEASPKPCRLPNCKRAAARFGLFSGPQTHSH